MDQYFCLTAWSEKSFVRLLSTYSVAWAASPDCGSKQKGFKSSSWSKGVTKVRSKKLTPKYVAKVAKFVSSNGNSYSKRIMAHATVSFVTTAVQHFSNKTGPNILVNVISLIIESIVKDYTTYSSDAIARVVYHDFKCWRARVLWLMSRFADIVIADITAGQINHYFAEIVPCTVYPLYGIHKVVKISITSSITHTPSSV